MRAGKLDRNIAVERLAEALDDYGVPRTTWSMVATIRAQLVQVSTEEFMRTAGNTADCVLIFRTRFLDSITTTDRITFDGRSFDIKEVKEIGRRKGLEIRTVARSGS